MDFVLIMKNLKRCKDCKFRVVVENNKKVKLCTHEKSHVARYKDTRINANYRTTTSMRGRNGPCRPNAIYFEQ